MQELDDPRPLDGARGHSEVEATRADSGDHRQPMTVEVVLKDRGLTFGSPGLDPCGSLLQPRLVDEDDDPDLSGSVFSLAPASA
jgi:hypothetical protein